jgi:hypothetical protein
MICSDSAAGYQNEPAVANAHGMPFTGAAATRTSRQADRSAWTMPPKVRREGGEATGDGRKRWLLKIQSSVRVCAGGNPRDQADALSRFYKPVPYL